jgi:hypothetical protein
MAAMIYGVVVVEVVALRLKEMILAAVAAVEEVVLLAPVVLATVIKMVILLVRIQTQAQHYHPQIMSP